MEEKKAKVWSSFGRAGLLGMGEGCPGGRDSGRV